MQVLDLFSGIGAYALGVERAGWKVVAFCENNPFCRSILANHWPDVPCYDDVTTLTADTLARDGIAVDVILGGWPCQDISPAGTGSGLDGERSGLWGEVARLAGELRPKLLVLENSSNLLAINGGRDFGRVLGDLAALGYDAEWHCLPAAAFDAPHIRDRLWIVAHRMGNDADADGKRAQVQASGRQSAIELPHGPCEEKLASDAPRDRRRPRRTRRVTAHSEGRADAEGAAYAHSHSHASFGAAIARGQRHSWEPEPDVVRVVHGAPNGVDRIHALGNCNPPIIPETIARAINAAHGGDLMHRAPLRADGA